MLVFYFPHISIKQLDDQPTEPQWRGLMTLMKGVPTDHAKE
jgi:hypothetical protein